MISSVASRSSFRAVKRFVLRFGLACAALFTLVNTMPASWLARPLNCFTAYFTGVILSLIGITAKINGVMVSHGGFSIRIITECTAVFVAILFGSFVFAYPATFRHKLQGMLIGIPFLFVANQLRILSIFLVGLKSLTFFQYAHVYIGQIVMVLLVILTTMFWLRSLLIVSPADTPLTFAGRFAAYSILLFPLWLLAAEHFVFANLHLVKWIRSLFGLTTAIPKELKIYPDTFNTFHFPGFIALILATRSVPWPNKPKGGIFGLLVLSATYLFFLLQKTAFLSTQNTSSVVPFVVSVLLNQWVLPFSLWLVIVRKEIFFPRGIKFCPICGERKTGLKDHIRAKHGE